MTEKEMLSLDYILQELAQIQDKGKELLFLRDVRKNYQALPEADKKAFDTLLYERAQALHAEVNVLCGV